MTFDLHTCVVCCSKIRSEIILYNEKRDIIYYNFTNVTNKANQNWLAFEEFRKFISLSVFDGLVESMSFYCGLHFKYQITILLNLNKNLMSNYNETLGFMLDHC